MGEILIICLLDRDILFEKINLISKLFAHRIFSWFDVNKCVLSSTFKKHTSKVSDKVRNFWNKLAHIVTYALGSSSTSYIAFYCPIFLSGDGFGPENWPWFIVQVIPLLISLSPCPPSLALYCPAAAAAERRVWG